MSEENPEKAKELAFVIPEDIKFDQEVSGLSDFQLQRWHDIMHVFFEKLLDGLGQYSSDFRWTFNKVIMKHKEIVREMRKRDITHYTPFNNLDNIRVLDPTKTITEDEEQELVDSNELDELDEELNEEIESESQEDGYDLTYDSPVNVQK